MGRGGQGRESQVGGLFGRGGGWTNLSVLPANPTPFHTTNKQPCLEWGAFDRCPETPRQHPHPCRLISTQRLQGGAVALGFLSRQSRYGR